MQCPITNMSLQNVLLHKWLVVTEVTNVACAAHTCNIALLSIVCRHVAPPGECYYNTLLCCKDYFASSSMVSRAFSALCVYSKFGNHPHPLGYLWATYNFFRGLHCWVSPWRITAYSVTQSSLNRSLTKPIWWPRNRSLNLGTKVHGQQLNNKYRKFPIVIILKTTKLSFHRWKPHITFHRR